MNIVRGVADLLRKSPNPVAPPTPVTPSVRGGSFRGADIDDAPAPRVVFGDSPEEGVLNTLWQKYENALDKDEKEKSLQIFLLQFVQTFRDWGPYHIEQLVDQELGSDETVVGCSHGHPSEVILILIQEISLITSTITESGTSPESSPKHSDQPEPLELSAERLHVLECLAILTRSVHNCRVFSYYGGVQKVTSLLKAAVDQLKTLNSLHAVDDQSSGQAVENTRMMLKILICIITIISNFIKLEPTVTRDPRFVDTTKYARSNSHLTAVTTSTSENSISDALQHWQQKAIVLVVEAGCVNRLVELLRVIQRLNLKEQWTDLSLHFTTLCTLRSTISGTRAQNHFRSIGGLEILLDGLGLPSNKFSVSKHSSISKDERGEILLLQILYLEIMSEAVFGNVSNLQFLCENAWVHKFANSISWPAFMIQEFHRQKDNTRTSLALDSISGPIHFLDITEWNDYSVKLSTTLCSFILPSNIVKCCSDEIAISQISVTIPSAYQEQSVRWMIRVLLTVFLCIKACTSETELPNHIKILAKTIQLYMIRTFRRVLVSAPALLTAFREEGVWDLIFSEDCFYIGSSVSVEDIQFHIVREDQNDNVKNNRKATNYESSYRTDVNILQVEAISFLEFAATMNENTYNLPECSALLDALEHGVSDAVVTSILLKCFRVILQLATEQTLASIKSLDAITRVLKVACYQAQGLQNSRALPRPDIIITTEGSQKKNTEMSLPEDRADHTLKCLELGLSLLKDYVTISSDGRILVLHNGECIECLFNLFQEENLRKHVLEQVLALFRLPPTSAQDHAAKLQLCSKYLENFTQANEKEKVNSELLIDLLVSMREIILMDRVYYQNLFRNGGCFLHIISLLNGTFDEATCERLVLNVLETLTLLLEGNNASKAAFRMLVGVGYQTLQSMLLDFYKWLPSERLLGALLSMLVDGKFEINEKTTIKNEDVVVLFLNVLQKSSTSLQHYGLVVLQQLLKQSITNRTYCFRAGLLSVLLDWFSTEENDDTVLGIAELIQIIGAHSICGKDIRKIFALLRSEKIGAKQKHTSLLLTSLSHMLKEKGPEAFFEFSGHDSGIEIKSPFQWPYNRGLSFSCWLRVENFPENGMMGLFSFFTEDGKGCAAMLSKSALVYESINQKHQSVLLQLNLPPKEWRFLSVTHTIGRAFSGGSQLRCYVDGELVSSEKCRYAKVNEVMTRCTIGTQLIPVGEEPLSIGFERTFAFTGQMGPVYVFSDALSSEQIKGIYNLGPSYMYSFHGDDSLYRGILDARDGISSKIIFGLNAQASESKTLFSVSSALDSADKSTVEATIIGGTKLCSRRLPQDIIYCVGGVSVFFPLFTQFCDVVSCHTSVIDDKLAAEVIELVASVLDGNVSNQQQMYLLSGLSILGFLLQAATPQLLNMKTLPAMKYMFDVLRNCGMSKVLLKDAISQVYLNPEIWLYASYEVQRDLYMFLIQYFETDGRFLPLLCGLPRVIDIVRQYYWEKIDSRYVVGSKPLLHPITKQVIGERPKIEEIRKLRLLLLSLAEMSIKLKVSPDDIQALVSFSERSQDIACIEDILNMIIHALSHSSLLSSFLEHVNVLGGCCIFLNLLKREFEPIRLLGLQLLGKLLVGIPSENKEATLFTSPIGQSRPFSENLRKEIASAPQLFFDTISERLLKFPLSDNLCATLFNVLLGGTSPKQVLQEHLQSDPSKDRNCNPSSLVYFSVPQILVSIFKYMQYCQDSSARTRILIDLLGLLYSNPINIEALMEHGWNSWLETSTNLDVIKDHKSVSKGKLDNVEINELIQVRNLYSLVLSYYLSSVKGGWHQLEDTAHFFLLKFDQGQLSSSYFLRDILDDIVGSLLQTSLEENIFLSQPCCDNVLHLLKLIQELLVNQIGIKLLFPSPSTTEESSSDDKWKNDIKFALNEILNAESNGHYRSFPWRSCQFADGDEISEDWWSFFDKVWNIICDLNGKGPSKLVPKSPNVGVPSLGQRARGLVESLNVPAAEMAAVVVSGGIGTALGAKMNIFADRATLLREEILPRIFFHLVILYLCKAGLENASKCVLQFMSLLPVLIAEDELSKNTLHFLIWSLLIVRSQYGQLDDGARFHVLSHLILETIIYGKSMLVTNILGRDDSMDINSNQEAGFILSFIQKDRVLATAIYEVKHMKSVQADRLRQLQELHSKLNECSTKETQLVQIINEQIHLSVSSAVSADDSRKTAFLLAFDEDQQIVADKWIHIFRALIDERGPWSANPFPNDVVTHWKLDKTEDKWRRRFKLKRNYMFDERLCQPSCSRIENAEPSVDLPSFSTKIPEKMRRFLLKGVRGITEDSGYGPSEDTNDMSESSHSPSERQNQNNAADSSDYRNNVQNKREASSTNVDNDYSKVLCSVHCVLVTPKRKLAGQLNITRTVLHFSFGFLVEGTGGSSVFSKFKDEKDSDGKNEMGGAERLYGCRDSLIRINGGLMQNQSNKIKHHRRWNITKIKGVHWTRYLLQYSAMEIFFDDSNAPIFLNFSSQKDAKSAGSLLVSLRNDALFPKGSIKDKNSVISFVDRRVALEMADNAKERWRRREISNFEYLMILNTLAGRSYNDLTQYPIYPWVLADYTSEKLDFNKSSTFRDLSKPVGALDEKRFKVFEDRYLNFCDPDIPSFYYGSHYSSMGIVLHYLLRLEPFTTLHRSLQGGKFDHADRLFQSIDGAYRNSLSNTSDVKELIPEFFYMPEFLENSNSYHLGVKQDGEPLGDVALPPWAKGSPEEFIHINREALESEYVSSNLHHWIDLVFGYKQRGQPAVEAANIFYYVTYEGAVDLENMDDMLQKYAIEDQIANFGQTPIQIFRVKHPRRGPPIPIAHPLYFAPQSITLTSSISSTASHMSAVLFIGLLDNTVILMNEGLVLSVKLWLPTRLQSGGNFTFSGTQENLCGIGSDIISPRKIGTFLAENVKFGRQFLATMQINSDKYLILCGNWENSFQIISLCDGRIVQSIRQHKDVVGCVAVSSDGNVVATGSYDTTVMIWHVFRGRPSEKKFRPTNLELSENDHVIMERPVHILCGHDDIITCLFVSTELDIVISGSKDGTCIFHTLREGRYVRSIRHPSGIGLSKLVASRHGRVVFYSESDLSLHMHSINGKHIASSASNGRLNCMELSCCGEFMVCAGTKDGSLLVFSIETPLLRRGSMPRTRPKPSATG
ncbi:BEACH domain-containing protein B [Brachypodium distachyon]|uniref:BEACH domain-containing protein B n=1 Tax=Brachypodium distachyon TaxID=15368 RepID=UPI000D0DBBA8|nr:BEACH domain-containing protein B [Brachypodium distachyon]|eukprot:XP_024315441.1 BEACH domain-containing protein B [Brachypodium distachyon]